MASPINPQDLASKVVTKEVVKWDIEDGGLIAREEMRIGSIVLRSTPIQNPDPEKMIEAITDAITEKGRQLLDWNQEVLQLLNRVKSLKKWNPSQTWLSIVLKPYWPQTENGLFLIWLELKATRSKEN